MDAASFYRDLEEQICQGDIFSTAPHLFLKEKLKAPSPIALAGKKAGLLTDELSTTPPAPAGTEVVVPAPCLVERAILITYDCEIDKDKKHRTIALIRPMASLRPE